MTTWQWEIIVAICRYILRKEGWLDQDNDAEFNDLAKLNEAHVRSL